MNKIGQNKRVIKVERGMEIKYNNDIRRLQYMTIEDIKQLIDDDEHRALELKRLQASGRMVGWSGGKDSFQKEIPKNSDEDKDVNGGGSGGSDGSFGGSLVYVTGM